MEKPNLNYIESLSGDNEEFKSRIIGILKVELPEETKIYYQLMQNQNFKQVAESVHKLKHKVSILGLEKSYYIAEQYEANLRDDSTQLQADFESILKNMQIFVDQL